MTAPADVRVVEVLCAPGDAARAGEPLVVLEPLVPSEERRVLESRVDPTRDVTARRRVFRA